MNIIPPIGTTGIWNVGAPFNVLLLPSTPYTLIAIRQLPDIVSSGGDPELDYYVSNGLASTRYQDDLVTNVAILTLQGSSGDVVYIPSSFVNTYPDIGGVPYTTLALAIKLGAIPDSLDLSYIKTRIAGVVTETLGIVGTVETVAISPPTLLPSVDADAIEAARQLAIGTVVTDYAMYLRAVAERDSARQRIAELEAYILANKTVLGI